MKTPEERLDLLLRVAGAGRHAAAADLRPAFGLEARVLAAWRASGAAPGWDHGVLARGLAVAALLVLASLWPAFERSTNSDSENLQLADSSVPVDLAP